MDVSNYPETLFLLSEKILKKEFVKDSSNINHMVKGIVLTNHTLRNFFSKKNFDFRLICSVPLQLDGCTSLNLTSGDIP